MDVCGRPNLEAIAGNFIEKRPNLVLWNTNEERNTEQTAVKKYDEIASRRSSFGS
jgi:hypothetical protein